MLMSIGPDQPFVRGEADRTDGELLAWLQNNALKRKLSFDPERPLPDRLVVSVDVRHMTQLRAYGN